MPKSSDTQFWIHALGAKAGGGITYLRAILPELAEQLEGKGVRVTLLVPSPLEGIELPDWFEVRPLKRAAWNALSRLLFDQLVLPLWLKARGASAIYCSGSYSPLLQVVPTTVLLRNAIYFDEEFLRRERPARRFLLRLQGRAIVLGARRAAVVYYPSRAMRELVESKAPELRHKGVVNYYGVGRAFAKSAGEEQAAPGSNNGREEPKTFLYVMNYTLQKNLGFLLKGLALAREAGLNVRVVVTSWLERGPSACFAEERAIIKEHDLIGSGYLLPVGPKYGPELTALYRSVDACIFPSICESFGHPLVEAITMGKPLICADRPYAREICGDYPVYVEPNHPKDLLAVWRDWLNAASDGPRGSRRDLLSRFSWREHAATLIRDCLRLSGRTKPGTGA